MNGLYSGLGDGRSGLGRCSGYGTSRHLWLDSVLRDALEERLLLGSNARRPRALTDDASRLRAVAELQHDRSLGVGERPDRCKSELREALLRIEPDLDTHREVGIAQAFVLGVEDRQILKRRRGTSQEENNRLRQ